MNPTHPIHRNSAEFAFLRLGATRLLLPRADVRILELAFDVDVRPKSPARGVGWVTVPGHPPCPVFCCTDGLEWLSVMRTDLPVCAVLTDHHGQDFGVLCSEMVMADRNRLLFSSVPLAMRCPSQPFEQLATDGHEVFCVTSAQHLSLALMPKGML
jgi:hypothetical protein